MRVTAPGSLFLLGEHSVLRGRPALVFAIDKKVEVSVERHDEPIVIIDSALGHSEHALHSRAVVAPHAEYVWSAVRSFSPSHGLRIKITSEMSHEMGLGTSAAVVVAVVAAMYGLNGESLDQRKVFLRSLEIVRSLKGICSGGDIAASVWGGLGLYRNELYERQEQSHLPLYLSYTGHKTPTSQVISKVKSLFTGRENILHALDHASEKIVLYALRHLHDPREIGAAMNFASGLMESLGVHTAEISRLLWRLRQHAYGAKMSGSGLGDCAIVLSDEDLSDAGVSAVNIASSGVACFWSDASAIRKQAEETWFCRDEISSDFCVAKSPESSSLQSQVSSGSTGIRQP